MNCPNSNEFEDQICYDFNTAKIQLNFHNYQLVVFSNLMSNISPETCAVVIRGVKLS